MSKRENRTLGRGLAVNTVISVIGGIRTAFNYAVKAGIIPSNPFSKVRLPAKKKSSADSMTLDEAWAFVSVKDDFFYGLAFVFQLHTGLRPQELMALIWDDIDFIKGTVHVERACKWIEGRFTGIGSPKSERGNRFIELAPELLDLLKIHFEKQQERIKEFNRAGIAYGGDAVKEWLSTYRPDQAHHYRNTNLIFPNGSGTVEYMELYRRQFKAMLRKARIDRKLRWYDLRHTHATFLLMMGTPDFEVADRMGHTVEQLRETYSHILEGRQRQASILFASVVPVECAQPKPTNEVKNRVYQYVGTAKGHLIDVMLGVQGTK